MGKKRKAAASKAEQSAEQSRHAHVHTDAAATGLGQAAANAPGRLAKGPLHDLCVVQPAARWSPPAVAPSASISAPAAAVELELARAAALDQLRHKLNSLCAKAGLRNVPLLAFERWRFAAKWAEDEPELAAAALALQDTNSSKPQAQTATAAAGDTSQKPAAAAGSSSKKRSRSSSQPSDPVIPFARLPQAPEPGLVADLIRSGLHHDVAIKIAMQLAAAAADLAAAILKRRHQLASGTAASYSDLVVSFHKHSLDIKCGGKFVKVSRTAYGKLARLYKTHALSRVTDNKAAAGGGGGGGGGECSIGLPLEEAAAKFASMQASCGPTAAAAAAVGSDEDDQDDDHDGDHGSDGSADHDDDHDVQDATAAATGKHHTTVLCAEAGIAEVEQQQQQKTGKLDQAGSNSRLVFHQRLFALLLRYKSIQGHGFQAAAGPTVFKLLRDRLSVGFECFASPLNAHFSRYASAFPDVDGPFGSAGSFFRLNVSHGSYEANPPFVPSLLTATALHIQQQLESCESSGGSLSFVLVMPGWQEVEGWRIVNDSRFLRKKILVAAADHGYCDGASHQRKDVYRQSPFDSALLFLQTTAAAKKWPVTDAVVRDLRAALAECCPTAAAADRQRKQRGLRDLEWQGLVSAAGRSDDDPDLADHQDGQLHKRHKAQQDRQQHVLSVKKDNNKKANRKKKKKKKLQPNQQ